MTTSISAEHLDRLLAGLPASYTIASQGTARFIVGPSGATVLLFGDDGLRDAADRVARLAAVTRAALADHLSWVPFVDSVVVTGEDGPERSRATESDDGAPSATVVPLDLLGEVLIEGPEVIDGPSRQHIVELLHGNGLSPWQVGLGASAAKIDLCEPAADTSATA